jgi:hypothetical protein
MPWIAIPVCAELVALRELATAGDAADPTTASAGATTSRRADLAAPGAIVDIGAEVGARFAARRVVLVTREIASAG